MTSPQALYIVVFASDMEAHCMMPLVLTCFCTFDGSDQIQTELRSCTTNVDSTVKSGEEEAPASPSLVSVLLV